MPVRLDDLSLPTVAQPAPTERRAQTQVALDDGGIDARILASVYSGIPAVVVSSPPGAGKTQTVAKVAAHLAKRGGLRVAVACPTNPQARQLSRRITQIDDSVPVTLYAAASRTAGLSSLGRVSIETNVSRLSTEPGVTVATVAKWLYVNPTAWHADVLVIEEAFQVCFADFAAVSPLAQQYVLLGDPGQIAPVIPGDTSRWANTIAAPDRPAPNVLVDLHPDAVTKFGFTQTRRFGPATAALVQPAFYPNLPFTSARAEATFTPEEADAPAAEYGTVIVDSAGSVTDSALAEACAAEATRLSRGTLNDWQGERDATTKDVGVVVAHVSQATAVSACLARSGITGIKVDTADRWQGLERPNMVVWHPLAGLREFAEFNAAPGRLCVMLSRHTTRLTVVCRADQPAVLEATRPDDDPARLAVWETQRHVLDDLFARSAA